MTNPPAPARTDAWLRAVAYGLLAEISTILTIIAVVTLYRYVFAVGRPPSEYEAFGKRAGMIVGITAGTLYTFLFARLLMRRLTVQHIAHGIVVALGAIALSVGGSLAGHQGLPSGYGIASVLKLAAGAIAGALAAGRGSQVAERLVKKRAG